MSPSKLSQCESLTIKLTNITHADCIPRQMIRAMLPTRRYLPVCLPVCPGCTAAQMVTVAVKLNVHLLTHSVFDLIQHRMCEPRCLLVPVSHCLPFLVVLPLTACLSAGYLVDRSELWACPGSLHKCNRPISSSNDRFDAQDCASR